MSQHNHFPVCGLVLPAFTHMTAWLHVYLIKTLSPPLTLIISQTGGGSLSPAYLEKKKKKAAWHEMEGEGWQWQRGGHLTCMATNAMVKVRMLAYGMPCVLLWYRRTAGKRRPTWRLCIASPIIPSIVTRSSSSLLPSFMYQYLSLICGTHGCG